MGLLLESQREYIRESGGRGRAMQKAIIWYRDYKKVTDDKTIVHTTERFKRGKIYIFYYPRPVKIHRLLPWDSHPIVLSLGQNETGDDIGINLNYVSMTIRLKLMDAVMSAFSTKIKNSMKGQLKKNASRQSALTELCYESVSNVLNRIEFKNAIRVYKNKRKSNQVVVSYDAWPQVTFLNLKSMKIGEK